MIHSASVYLVVAPVVLNSLKTAATQLSRLRPPCAARICETGKPHFAGTPPPQSCEVLAASGQHSGTSHLSRKWACVGTASPRLWTLQGMFKGVGKCLRWGGGEREKGREEEREGESPTGRQGLASKCKSNPKSISFIDCLQMQC